MIRMTVCHHSEELSVHVVSPKHRALPWADDMPCQYTTCGSWSFLKCVVMSVCHQTDMTTHTRVDTCTYKSKQQHRKLPEGKCICCVCTSMYITGITDEGTYVAEGYQTSVTSLSSFYYIHTSKVPNSGRNSIRPTIYDLYSVKCHP